MNKITKIIVNTRSLLNEKKESFWQRRIKNNIDKYCISLCFHDVGGNLNSPYTINKDCFNTIIEKIKQYIIPIDEFSQKKGIIVTFDDGYESVYSYVYPLFKKLGLPFTVYVITDKIGEFGYLSKEQITEMSEDRKICTIGSHMCSHRKTRDMSNIEIEYEWKNSKIILESITDKTIMHAALPYGTIKSCSELSIKLGFENGYKTIATTRAVPCSKNGIINRFVYQNNKKYII